MARTVLNLEEYTPHAVIDCTSISKLVHVVPLSLVKDWAEGNWEGTKKPPKDILQRIIAEWFGFLDQEGWKNGDGA